MNVTIGKARTRGPKLQFGRLASVKETGKALQLRWACMALPLLAGCDDLPGPRLTNAYGVETRLIVDFNDGFHGNEAWPSCRLYVLGGINRKDFKPIYARIEKDGKLLREFSAEELQKMEKDQEIRHHDGTGWNIDSDGARLISDDEPNPCRKD